MPAKSRRATTVLAWKVFCWRGRRTSVGSCKGGVYRGWAPSTAEFLAANYTPETVAEGKARCKADLQERLGLPQAPDVPILGVVARLAEQKGIDLILRCAEPLIALGVQLVVLGEGDREYQRRFQALQ